jgi:hypothetical protein
MEPLLLIILVLSLLISWLVGPPQVEEKKETLRCELCKKEVAENQPFCTMCKLSKLSTLLAHKQDTPS